jgi:hypothetical protein
MKVFEIHNCGSSDDKYFYFCFDGCESSKEIMRALDIKPHIYYTILHECGGIYDYDYDYADISYYFESREDIERAIKILESYEILTKLTT